MKKYNLVCTKCGKTYDLESCNFRCDDCNEPLEVELITTGSISKKNPLTQLPIERYADFFPYIHIDPFLSLGEGYTPLVNSAVLAEKVGVKNLYLKNESANPTWSFKDRGTVIGIQVAKKLGYTRIGTVSTGNMAASVAAYGAKANLETFVFVSANIAQEKLNPIAIYRPILVKVEGDYSNMYYESLKIGKENNIFFINSDQIYRTEGAKTIAFEICEQLNFDLPDYVIVPTSAGGHIRGINKGFQEFYRAGIIHKIPKIICGQAAGCSPIVNAFTKKEKTITRVENPHTIAHAIENPFPPSGNATLKMLEQINSIAVNVSEEEIIQAQALQAESGIFGQPASCVPLAVALKLGKQNFFKMEDRVVLVVTGSGLKYAAAFDSHELKKPYECKLEDLGSFIKNNF